MQLLVTTVIAIAITAIPPLTRLAAGPASPLPAVAAVASLGLVCWMSFSDRARHEHPLNLILLAAFTVAESVVVGAICAQYTLPSVLLAFAATGVAAGAVSASAAHSKTDLTMHGGAMLSALVAFLCVSVLAAVMRVRFMDGVLAAGGAVLFAAYLAVDVQLIFDNSASSSPSAAGGSGAMMMPRRAVTYGPDEYVAASLAVYLDVVNMLVHLLRLMGERRD